MNIEKAGWIISVVLVCMVSFLFSYVLINVELPTIINDSIQELNKPCNDQVITERELIKQNTSTIFENRTDKKILDIDFNLDVITCECSDGNHLEYLPFVADCDKKSECVFKPIWNTTKTVIRWNRTLCYCSVSFDVYELVNRSVWKHEMLNDFWKVSVKGADCPKWIPVPGFGRVLSTTFGSFSSDECVFMTVFEKDLGVSLVSYEEERRVVNGGDTEIIEVKK